MLIVIAANKIILDTVSAYLSQFLARRGNIFLWQRFT
ncbi:hypothetical protein S2091_1224 [Solimicrobium silvestre]|uniref:Uncharacterized protein n=1 Tax=Solimicrobium silvestre TaxID=2099400 RepID=A0A2S9H235_9BURK|nr:hypothetical protein S2091_1224 [Solimicrobium silvestre]